MNVFHKITRKSLEENRTRTIVTIIGIILSMSLFTAVIEGAYSGVQFLLRSEIENVGAYHACYTEVTEEKARELVLQDDIKEYATWQLVGWSHIETDVDSFSPYLSIVSISDNFPDLVTTKLIDGRMPENENEIILPSNYFSLMNNKYVIGDQITLSVGKRMANGQELGSGDDLYADVPEEISDAHERTYTIVGVYRSFSYELNPSTGYPALTKGAADGKLNVFFTLKNIRTIYSEFIKNQQPGTPIAIHSDLLMYYGMLRNDYLMVVLYGLVAILIALISFGSISLIYNSFSISVSERTRQFGILRSIGATKKQIRQSVFYEAFVLAGIGIPLGLVVGCIGIGITLRCLQDSFAMLLGYSDTTVKMELVLNPFALLGAALVCLLTVLLSAWIPAKRSTRINAIEAIRQVDDLKIKGKEIRTSKLTEKLFGFEGMMAAKNFKRNKKRYRSTVLSIFLSIVLFISATSFCSYLTGTVSGVTSNEALTDIKYRTVGDSEKKENPDDVLSLLSSVEGVTDALYMDSDNVSLFTDFSNLDSSYTQKPFEEYADENSAPVYGYIVFVNDETFRAVCRENSLNADNYFNADHPVGILYNHCVESYQETEESPRKWYSYKTLDESKLPCTLYHRTAREFDGYDYVGYDTEPDGSTSVVYYPTEYIEEYWQTLNEGRTPDENLVMRKTLEEGTISSEFVVDAVINTTLFSLQSDTLAIIYPYSMEGNVLDDVYMKSFAYETSFHFLCNDYNQVYEDMKQLLLDHNMDSYRLDNAAEAKDATRTIVTVIKVFAYGFITLISLIAIANVFNTISTSIMLRRREFAMLKSIGLGKKGFSRMMNYECIIYGLKGILYGLPVAVVITYAIYRVTRSAFETSFYIPWSSIVIAVGSVFVVVFATMLYATEKIKNDNPIDAQKNENL